MLHTNNPIIKHKAGLLNLAEELGNVSKACKVMGVSRDTFSRYQGLVEDGGIVFVIRHIMINLFNHKMDTDGIYALSTLLFPLGAIRIGISVTTHFEKELAHSRDDSAETQG